jgi:glycosyltransferase involved in cell wall biosynthesis
VAPLIRGLPRSQLIYHCVDRWSAFSEYNTELMDLWEAELCGCADLVLASASELVDRCRQYNARVHYVPHGVDYEHFSAALADGPVPEELERIRAPRVGFFGLIHEWVDLELVGALARRTEYSFVLLGEPIVPVDEIAALDNVHFIGRRPYASLPSYCRGFQAAIVPFRSSELTKSVNPVKLREYAAAGLPIVSTDLPEVRRCAKIAACADDLESWLKELTRAVERGVDQSQRHAQSARVREEDWAVRCEEIGELLAPRSRVSGSVGWPRRPMET